LNLFAPAPLSPQCIELDYGHYLDTRDGEAQEARRTRIDERLAHHFSTVDPEIAEALDRIRQGEEFGVSILRGFDSPRSVKERVAAQELDHVAILGSLVEAFGGAPNSEAIPPVLRRFIGIVVRLPDRLMALPLFLAELAGVAVFLALRERIVERSLPLPGGEEILRLFDDIVVDEVGHVSFHHASLRPWEMGLARWVGRPFFWLLGRSHPPARPLLRRLGRNEFCWSDIPPDVLVQSWAPAARGGWRGSSESDPGAQPRPV
jgi:hypothetical protein